MHPLHLYFLEVHRERIARYDRDVARHYESSSSSPTAAPASRARTGLLRRRPAQLVARDAC